MSSQWKFDDSYSNESGGGFVSPERRFGILFQEYVEQRRDPAMHQQHTYPAFRKIFWDEPIHNPHLRNVNHIDAACEAFDKERKEYWKPKGPKWLPPQTELERMVPGHEDHPSLRQKLKELMDLPRPKRDPFNLEKSEQYWGRERRINPYARAKVYTRPQDRHRPVTKSTGPKEPYVLPDEWLRSAQPVCGVVRPSSFMASKTKREFPVKPAEGLSDSYDAAVPLISGAQKPKSSLSRGGRAGTRSESSLTSERLDDLCEMGSNIRLRSRHHSADVFNAPLSTEQSSLAFSFGKSPKLPAVDSLGKSRGSSNPNRGVKDNSEEIANIYIDSSRHEQLMNLSSHGDFAGEGSLTLRLEDPSALPAHHPLESKSMQNNHLQSSYALKPRTSSSTASRAISPFNVPPVPILEVPPSPLTRYRTTGIPMASKVYQLNGISRDSIESETESPVDICFGGTVSSTLVGHTRAPQIEDYSHLDHSHSSSHPAPLGGTPLKDSHFHPSFQRGVVFDPNPTIYKVQVSKSNRNFDGETRPKTIGQKLKAQSKTEQPQSRDAFSQLLNRSRPHALQLHKKVSMHVADVASISPFRRSPTGDDNSTDIEAFGKNSLNRDDELTQRWIARSLNRKHLDGMGLKLVVESDGVDKNDVMKHSSDSSLAILRQLENAVDGEG